MKGKSATLLVLVVAAVVLGCFAVKSYFDFQVTKLKHQYEQQGGQPASAGQATVGTAGAIPPPPGVGTAPAPSAVAVAPAPAPALPVPAPAPAPIPSAHAETADSLEMARIKAELDAMRREKALIDERANKLSGAGDNGTSAAGTPEVAPAAPAAGKIGGAPPLASDDPTVQALRQQILTASAIGRVAAYHQEFDRVTIEGGSERNIRVDDKFAVRRGHEIMGFLKVEEVEQGSCHAVLTSKNAQSETARKPQAGDDIIKWPPL